MIFNFKTLIACASRFTTLFPGDLPITGARRGAERVSHAVR
jgi:2-keto-4-pentenoate hydratase/2-oxohepta-3-ene-1,7-dioic acid hydratase in catechol pathway